MKKALGLFVIGSCVSICIVAQKKLVIIGSSTSACTGPASFNECFVGRLQSYYNKQFPFDTAIVNDLAKGGTNCYNAMPTGFIYPGPDPNGAYAADVTRNITAALSQNPDVILVNFPSNAYNTLSVSEILFAFRTIRNTATQNNVPCFITTTQPRNDAAFNNSAQKRKMADIKDSILQQFGTKAIDFWSELYNTADTTIRTAYNSGDDIHINSNGHQLFFDRVVAKNIFAMDIVLPANFINYNAQYNKGKVKVQFTTTAEKEIAVFEIQRSTNNNSFITIGKLSPHNNGATHSYLFEDANPVPGINYYRIAVVNRHQSVQFSPIQKITAIGKSLSIKKITNKNHVISIELQSLETHTVEFQLLNNHGIVLAQQSRNITSGTSVINLPFQPVATGIYYLRLLNAKMNINVTASFIKK